MITATEAQAEVAAILTEDLALMSCGARLIAEFGQDRVFFDYDPIPCYTITFPGCRVTICNKQMVCAEKGDIVLGQKIIGFMPGDAQYGN